MQDCIIVVGIFLKKLETKTRPPWHSGLETETLELRS